MKRVLFALAVLLGLMTVTSEASAWGFGRRGHFYRHHHHHYRVAPIYRYPSYHVRPRTRVYYGAPRIRFYHPPVYGGFYYSGPGVSVGIGF